MTKKQVSITTRLSKKRDIGVDNWVKNCNEPRKEALNGMIEYLQNNDVVKNKGEINWENLYDLVTLPKSKKTKQPYLQKGRSHKF